MGLKWGMFVRPDGKMLTAREIADMIERAGRLPIAGDEMVEDQFVLISDRLARQLVEFLRREEIP